jgi:hypothetical protein
MTNSRDAGPDLTIEVRVITLKQIGVARRFHQVINVDKVFGTHTGYLSARPTVNART